MVQPEASRGHAAMDAELFLFPNTLFTVRFEVDGIAFTDITAFYRGCLCWLRIP